MWKPDEAVSDQVLLQGDHPPLLRQDHKSSLLTFNNESTDPESVGAQTRSCRGETLYVAATAKDLVIHCGPRLTGPQSRWLNDLITFISGLQDSQSSNECVPDCTHVLSDGSNEFKDDAEAAEAALSSVFVNWLDSKLPSRFSLFPPSLLLVGISEQSQEVCSIKETPELSQVLSLRDRERVKSNDFKSKKKKKRKNQTLILRLMTNDFIWIWVPGPDGLDPVSEPEVEHSCDPFTPNLSDPVHFGYRESFRLNSG